MIKANLICQLSFICSSLITPVNQVFAQSNYSIASEFSFFRASPQLIDSNSSFKGTDVLSRYNFVIRIPSDADNSLKKLVINQQSNTDVIKIYPQKTKVFLLTDNTEELIENSTDIIVDNRKNTSEITIDLAQPIPAGSTVKVVLRARNPLFSGIYQFGVKVFPAGNNPRSLYLGIARFHFYRHGRY